MAYDELLDRLWMFDSEVFAHDHLFVFINYRTGEEVALHNAKPDDYVTFFDKYNPILCGFNAKSYDNYILQAILNGYSPEEVKKVNDFIIAGANGYELGMPYTEIPTVWDVFLEINPRKSLKELEGNMRLDITETTIPFDLPTKLTDGEYQEVLYYCEHDVRATKEVFDRLKNKYKSKYIIAKLGKLNPEKALAMTDANLTAALLGAERKEHKDNFIYTYPDVIDKNKIPKDVLNYIDDIIEHNDLSYKPEAPSFKIDDCLIQIGIGGIHGAKETTFIYGENEVFECE